MDERRALVAAILAEPEDDTPRLVFADWLDEHDEPDLAELIRTQCAAERAGAAARPPLDARAAELQAEHFGRWLGPLGPHVHNEPAAFRRGMIAAMVLPEAQFVAPDVQAGLAEVAPSFGLAFLALTPRIEARSPLVGLLRSALARSPEGFVRQETVIDQVLRSPALAWVAALHVTGPATSDDALAAVADCPHLGRLSGLWLAGPCCTDAGLRRLARTAGLPNLRRFGLSDGGLTSARYTTAGVMDVLNSANLPRLDELEVTGAPRRFDLDRVLADPATARLRKVTLGSADALGAVARARHLTRLESLTLKGLQAVVTDRDANELLGNPALAGVKTLVLMVLRRANVRLSAAAEGRLRDRFGDGYQRHDYPLD